MGLGMGATGCCGDTIIHAENSKTYLQECDAFLNVAQ